MKKILLSFGIIIFTLGSVALGGTGAFFSDTETSSGNTFTAGAIDLKVDNTSYYNGAVSSTTSWSLEDLTIQKFFNFLDLKPGDFGEDTISLHVDTNDAYLCANVTLTSDDDNGFTEPEAEVDITDGPGNGELAQNVNFIWWADDGDNVLENDENVISEGPIGDLTLNSSTTVPLADSATNIWTGVGGPVPGEQTLYIGKAWCFGELTPAPLNQDGLGTTSPTTPANSNGGIICDGSGLDNITQTDSLTADVSFTAVQARHNDRYLCAPPVQQGEATLTVVKVVNNNHGGNNIVTDFHLFADGSSGLTPMTSGVPQNLPSGTYDVTETGVPGYIAAFSGDCDASGNIVLNPGDNKTCTINNTDQEAHITLVKNVINNNAGTATANSAWGLKIDGAIVPNNTSVTVNSNTPHTINENGRAGYHFVSITGNAKCPAILGGTATLDEGESITCTITNDDN